MKDFEDKIYHYTDAIGPNANGNIYSIPKNAQALLGPVMMSHGVHHHMPGSWTSGGYSGGHAAVWTGIQGSQAQYVSGLQGTVATHTSSKHSVLNVVIRSIMFHIASCLHEAGLLYELVDNKSKINCVVAVAPTYSITFSAQIEDNEHLVVHVWAVNVASSFYVANSATYYDEDAVDCPKLLEVLRDKFNVRVEGRISSESTFQYMDDMLRKFIHAVQENPTGENQSVGRTAL